MGMNYMDAEALKQAFLAGAEALEARKEWINELNVFPVPDGDTGTNMAMTILSAAREVAAIENPDMELLAKAISSGSLRGARGNSGVILSQLLRGFTREISACETIDTECLARAFRRGTETAYKAVMKPKEGTILTVARGMADRAQELAPQIDDILEFAGRVIEHGDYVLSQTPEMLPVLKQAGVVDSGGQGLMQLAKGCVDGLRGSVPLKDSFGDGSEEKSSVYGASEASYRERKPGASGTSEAPVQEESTIKFGYCTEFIINLEGEFGEAQEKDFKQYLESIGDSLVVVADEELVKVHVHTNDPGLAVQKGLSFGSLSRIKIDNMREEHEERLIRDAERLTKEQKEREEKEKTEPRRPAGFVAVCAGEGLTEIFRGIGADWVIEGGQTMNPSTEDIQKAVEQVNAENVYILPNNKNIILAAEQAAGLVSDRKAVVVPSKTVPQGITALINFAPDLPVKENLEIMGQEMGRVRTGQITYAVRNTSIDGKEIGEGDIIGLGDSGLLASGASVTQTALDTLEAMVDGESELITIYYGESVKQEDADTLLASAKERFGNCEIELHYGGQPVYYYIISVE